MFGRRNATAAQNGTFGFKFTHALYHKKRKISRQQLFKFHYDTYTQAGSKAMALAVQRYIKETAKHFRTTRQFVDDIRRKILYTHEYNCEVAKLNLTSKYPKTINFVQLLVKYLELEHELVVKLSPEFPSLESKRQSLVDRLLKTIFQDIVHYSMEKVSTEHLKLLSVVDCLKLLILVRPEYKKETSILDKIATNLLETVGCKELFDKHIKGKHLPFKNESFRKENQSNGLAILGNLTTSDYESDSDSDFDVSKFSDIVQSYAKKKASYVSDGCSTSSDDVFDNCLLKKQIARKPSDTIATVSPPEEDVEEKYVPPTSYNSAIQPIQFRQKEVVTFVLLDSDDDDDNDYIMCISKEVESNSKPKNRLKHTPIQEDCKDGIIVQVDDTVQNDDANNVISVPVNASAQIKSQSALPPENVILPIECVDSYNKCDNLKISEECSSRINDIMVDWSDTEEDSNSFIQNNNDANSVLDELEPNGVVDLNIKQENLMTDTSKNFESIRLEMKDGVNNIDDDDDDVQIIEDIKPAKLDLSDDDDVIEIIDNVKEVAKDNVNTINTTESIIIIDDDIATDCIDNINVTKKEETPVNVASTGPSFAEMNSTNNIICLEETEIQTLDLQIEESKKCIVVPEHVEDDFEQIVKDLERTIKVSESMEKSRESDESIVEEPSQVVDVVPEQIIMEAQEVSEEHLTEETQQPIQETEEFIVHTVKPTQIIVQQIMVQPSEIIVQTPQIIVEPPQIIVQSDQIMELNRFKLDKISEPSSENENHEPLNLTEVSTQSVVSFNNDTTEVTSQPDKKPLEPVEIVSHDELVPLAEENKSDNATSTKPEVPSDIAMNVTNVANVESTTNVTKAKPVATVLDEPVTTVKVVAIDEEFVPTENKEVIQEDSSAEIIEEPVTEALQENPVTGEIIKEPVTESNLENPELTEEICEEPVTVTSKSIQEDPAMEPMHIEPATELLQENSISKATHETDRVIENDEPLNLTEPKVCPQSVFNSIEPDVAPLNLVKNETVVPSDVALPNEILPPETGCAPSKAIYEETEIILSDNLKLLVDVSLNYPMEKMSISKKKLSPRRHKIIEVNNTSEDSNDSEGLLCIDEAINLFDENTVEEEIKFCNSQHEKPVLISIPETPEAEDDFHILQQLESLVEQEDKSSDSSLDNIPLSDVKKLIGNKPVEPSVPKFKTKAAVKAYEKLYVKLEKMSLEEVQNKLVRSKSCDIEMGDVKSKRGNSGDRRSSVTIEMLSQEGVEEVKELAKKKRRLGMRVVVRRSVCDEKPEEDPMEKNKSNQPPADIIPQDLSSNLMEHENKTEAVTPSVDAIAEETKPTKPVKAKRGRSKRNRKKPVETINNEKKETPKAKPSILTLTPETKPDECISPTKGGKDLNSLVDKLKKKLEIESTEKSKNGKSKKTKPQNERLPVNGFLVEECKKDVEMMTIKKPRKPGRTGKKKKVDVDVVLNVETKIEEVAPSRDKILSPGADADSKKKDVVYLSKKHIIMMNLNKEQEQLRLNNERKKRSAAVDDCDGEAKRKRTDSLDVVVMKEKLTNKMIKGDLMVKDDEGNCLVEKSFDTNEVMEYETKGINEECMAKVVEVEPVAMVNVEEPAATLVVEEPVVDESVANVNEYVAMVNVEEHVTEEVMEKSIITVPEENFVFKVHNKEPVTELIQDDSVAKDVVKKPVSTVNQGVPVTELIQDDTDAKEVAEPVTMVARQEYVTQMHVEEDPVTEIIQNDTVAMEIVVPVETVAVEESFTNVAMKEPVSMKEAEVHVTKVNVEEPVSTVNHQYPVTEIVQNDTVAMEIVVPVETVAVEESFTNVAMKEPASMKDAEVHVTKVNVEEPVSTVNHQYPVTEIVQNDTVAMEIVVPVETVAVEESFTNVAMKEPVSMKDAEVHVTKVNVEEPVSTVNHQYPVTEIVQNDTVAMEIVVPIETVAVEESFTNVAMKEPVSMKDAEVHVTKVNVEEPVSTVNHQYPVTEIVQNDTVAMEIVAPIETVAVEESFTNVAIQEPLSMKDAEVHVTKVNVEEPVSTVNEEIPVTEVRQDDTATTDRHDEMVAMEEYVTKANVDAPVSIVNQEDLVVQYDTVAMKIVEGPVEIIADEEPFTKDVMEEPLAKEDAEVYVTKVNVEEPASTINQGSPVAEAIQDDTDAEKPVAIVALEEYITKVNVEAHVSTINQGAPVAEVIQDDTDAMEIVDRRAAMVAVEAPLAVVDVESSITTTIEDEHVTEVNVNEPVSIANAVTGEIQETYETNTIYEELVTEMDHEEFVPDVSQEHPVTEVIPEAYVTVIPKEPVTKGISDEPVSEEVADEPVTEAISHEPGTEVIQAELITEAIQEEPVTEVIKEDSISTTLIEVPDNHEQITRDSMVNYPENDENVPTERSGSKIHIISNIIIPKVPTSMTLRDEEVATYSATDTYQGVITSSETDIETQPESSDLTTLQPPDEDSTIIVQEPQTYSDNHDNQTSSSDNPVIEMEFNSDSPEHMLRDMSESTRTSSLDIEDSALNMDSSSTLTSMIDGGNGNNTIENYLVEPYVSFTDNTTIVEVETSSLEDVNLTNKPQPSTVNVADFWEDFPSTVAQSVAPSAVLTDINSFQPCASSADTIKLFNALATSQADPKQCVSPLFLQDISPSKLGIKTTNNMRMVSQQSSQSEMPSTSMDDFTEFKPEFSDKVQAGHHNYISFGGPLLAGSFGDSPEFEDIFDYGTDYAVKNILQRSASEPTSYHVIDPYLDDLIDNSLTTSNKESINSGCLVNSMNSRETQVLMDGAILSESSKGSMDSENMDTNINPMTAPDLINESEPMFSKPICWSTDLYKKEEETIKAGASDSPVWNDLDLISEEIISTSETIPQATKENKSPLSSSKVVVLPAAAPLSTPSYHMNQNDLKSFNTLMEEYDITESRFSEASKDANPKRTCPATRSQPSDSFDKLIASDVTFEAAIPKKATPKKAPLETTSRPKTKPSPIGFNGDMEVPAENSKPKETIALINGIPSRTNSRTRPKPPPRNKGTRSKENSPKYTEALDTKSTEMLLTRSPKTDDLKFKTSVPTIVVEKSLDRVQSINHVNQSDVTNKTGLPTLGFSEQPIIETSSTTRRKQSPRNKSTSSKENSPEGVQSINHVNQSDITKKTGQPTLSFSERPTTDISSITRQKLPQRNKNTSFKENSPKHETIDSKSPVINVILNKPKDTDDVIVKDDLLVRKSPKEVQPPNHTHNLINSVEVPIEKVKLASSSLPEEAKMEISSTPKLKPSPTNKNTESKENLPKTSDLSQLIKPHENVKNDVPKSPARKASVEETPARISIGDSVKLRKRKVTNQNLSCHSIDNLLKNDERSQRQKYMEKHSESMKRKINKEPPIDKKQKRDNVKEQKNIVEDMNVRFDRLKYGTSIEKEDRPKTELTTSSSRHLHNAHSGYQVGSNRPPSYDSRSGHQNRVHSSRPSSSSSMPYANSKSEPHKPLGLHIGSTNQSSWGSGSQSHRFPSSRDQSHHRPGSSSHRRRETEEDKIRINETINNLRRKRENSRLSEKLPPPVSSNANVAKDFLWIRQVSERVDKDNWYTTSDIFPTSVQNQPRKRSNDKRT